MKLATTYLARYPSDSYTLRDLGNRLEQFLHEEPQWSAPRQELARDMVRFEWAQVVAFDGATVEDACAETVTASDRANNDWAAQIKEWFDNWSALGWFCRPS